MNTSSKKLNKNRYNGRKDEVIMKYFVIATHWDDNRKAQVKYIAGQFDNYMNASLFKKAYNEYYSTNAVIVEDFAMLNQ